MNYAAERVFPIATSRLTGRKVTQNWPFQRKKSKKNIAELKKMLNFATDYELIYSLKRVFL